MVGTWLGKWRVMRAVLRNGGSRVKMRALRRERRRVEEREAAPEEGS